MAKYGIANVEIVFSSLAKSLDAVPPTKRSADIGANVITFRSLSSSLSTGWRDDDTIACDMRALHAEVRGYAMGAEWARGSR